MEHFYQVRSSLDILVERLNPSSTAYSLDFRPAGQNEGANRRMGIAILTFGAEIIESGLLDRTVFPERSLWARIVADGRSIKALTFHSLTGVGYKNAKSSNFATIADYLQRDVELDFMCFDANEPKIDALEIENVEFWQTNGDRGRKAELILGARKVHPLRDAFRSHAERGNSRESTALPVTHLTRGVPRRYDYIFASPKWRVERITHPLEESLAASSDHSVVVADFVYGGGVSQQ